MDLFLPDCFGFGYVVPTVAAHCGLKGLSSTRIGVGASIPMPFQNIGRWIGPDGGSMIAVVQPGAYGQDITENLANSSYYHSPGGHSRSHGNFLKRRSSGHTRFRSERQRSALPTGRAGGQQRARYLRGGCSAERRGSL